MIDGTVILRITNPDGDSDEFVLGEGQGATLTVPARLRRRSYLIELVQAGTGGEDRGQKVTGPNEAC